MEEHPPLKKIPTNSKQQCSFGVESRCCPKQRALPVPWVRTSRGLRGGLGAQRAAELAGTAGAGEGPVTLRWLQNPPKPHSERSFESLLPLQKLAVGKCFYLTTKPSSPPPGCSPSPGPEGWGQRSAGGPSSAGEAPPAPFWGAPVPPQPPSTNQRTPRATTRVEEDQTCTCWCEWAFPLTAAEARGVQPPAPCEQHPKYFCQCGHCLETCTDNLGLFGLLFFAH